MTTPDCKCGIVMPISEIEGCNEGHWKDVLSIIESCISDIGLVPNLVSDSDESGIIQKRIIDNLYSNPIVICDTSCRNPNVMFELGLRLAFDKPTIIIKDDKTPYSFDTSIIEHISYPRDLKYSEILKFREKLKSKLKATLDEAHNNSNYSTFLSHFGRYKIAEPNEIEISSSTYILKSLNDINENLNHLVYDKTSITKQAATSTSFEEDYDYLLIDLSEFKNDLQIKRVNVKKTDSLSSLLDRVYYMLDSSVKPYTYEYDWVLFNIDSNQKIISNRSIHNTPKGEPFEDYRTLKELNIRPHSRIKAIKIDQHHN